jgi:hypothetical protein
VKQHIAKPQILTHTPNLAPQSCKIEWQALRVGFEEEKNNEDILRYRHYYQLSTGYMEDDIAARI